MTRPRHTVVCLGTATDIGKTWVGAAALSALRAQGTTVAARKPAQSFDPSDTHPTDAEVLASATGEDPTVVCRPDQWLPVALAPPMAADVLGRSQATLAEHLAWLGASWPPAPVDVGWVETVGGPHSPITEDADGVDLARAVAPDQIVLVADATLGTLNAVRLCVEALRVVDCPLSVLLNRFDATDDLHRRNLAWLRDRDGLIVEVLPSKLVRIDDHRS